MKHGVHVMELVLSIVCIAGGLICLFMAQMSEKPAIIGGLFLLTFYLLLDIWKYRRALTDRELERIKR